jgi:hypothetical protein
MALIFADRVKESTTTSGTGTITLAGAQTGYQSFAVVGNGNTCYYTIADQAGTGTGAWEVGVGTYSTTGPTLARTTVLASSNSGSLVSFGANAKDVFLTSPAEKFFGTDQTLGISNGGTNSTATPTAGGAVYGTGTAYGITAAGTSGQPLISAGASAPSFGTLGVSGGGTGATTLTGVLKGNGTSAFTAATAGTDFVAPGTATTFTATQTFSGSSSTFATSLLNASETFYTIAAAPSSSQTVYINNGSVQYFTSNAANNWTLNIAFSSGTSLNTALATGQAVTLAVVTTQSTTAYYNSAVQIDGTSVTPKWQGGAPTAGNASGLDVYTYTVIKTGSATYTVLASLVQFK